MTLAQQLYDCDLSYGSIGGHFNLFNERRDAIGVVIKGACGGCYQMGYISISRQIMIMRSNFIGSCEWTNMFQ